MMPVSQSLCKLTWIGFHSPPVPVLGSGRVGEKNILDEQKSVTVCMNVAVDILHEV